MYLITTIATSETPRIRMSVRCAALVVKGSDLGHTGSVVFAPSTRSAAKTAPQGIWAWSPPA